MLVKPEGLQTVNLGMKMGQRVAVALYAGFILYSILTFGFGQSGIGAMSDMQLHRDGLEQNIVDLRQIGTDLRLRQTALLNDPNEAVQLARRLGYYSVAEIRLVLPESEPVTLSRTLGRMVERYGGSRDTQTLFRAIGVLCGLVVFVFVVFIGSKPRGRQ